MILVDFLNVVLVIVLCYAVSAELVLPLWRGTVLFPHLRRRYRELDQKHREVVNDLDIDEMQEEIEELKKHKKK